jgi:hypothetical protein
MARMRGWAKKGERCRAAIPHGHWKTVTFLDGLTANGFIAPMLLDGPMDGEAFVAWCEQLLAPALAEDSIVVMDNLAAHKVTGVREAIEARGGNSFGEFMLPHASLRLKQGFGRLIRTGTDAGGSARGRSPQTPAILARFHGKNRPEMAPHAYMVAETAFHQMVDDEENQVTAAAAGSPR